MPSPPLSGLATSRGFGTHSFELTRKPLTKKKLEYNAKNLNDFDAVLFYTGGTLEMDDQKKGDFLSFVHDDGKGLHRHTQRHDYVYQLA